MTLNPELLQRLGLKIESLDGIGIPTAEILGDLPDRINFGKSGNHLDWESKPRK